MATTVTVTIAALQITGQALPRAKVTFELTGADHEGAVIVPKATTVTLGDAGTGTATLFANAAGTQGTQYRVTIRSEDDQLQFSGLATVPAVDCNLHQVLNTAPPTAASDALEAVNLARLWAMQVPGTVDGVDKSAKGYALDAGASATQTALDRVQTGLDRTQTALDRVQTGLDRTQTGLNRIATAADVVLADASSTQAAASATSAQAYAAAALATVRIKADTAAGLAAYAVGEYFLVPVSASNDLFILYEITTGPVATERGRYASTTLITDLAGFPFRREDYGHAKAYPNTGIVSSSGATIDSSGGRFTLAATTGSLVLSGTIGVVQNDTIVVWFEATDGLPSTAQLRFYNGGSALDTAQNLTRIGNHYMLVATATNASTTTVRITVTNTGGSPITFTRPNVAFRRTTTKGLLLDPNVVALRNATARSDADRKVNLWRSDSVGKVSGSGTSPTLNADGTVTCPPDAIHWIRGDLAFAAGATHAWLVKVDDANPNIRFVRINYVGTGSGLVTLDYLGGGWWGKVTTVPAVVTTVYVRVEVDNSTSTLYTAADATVKGPGGGMGIWLVESTQFPNELPLQGGPWDKDEIVIQQGSNRVDVFFPGSHATSNKYIRWRMEQISGQTGGGAGWKLGVITEATRISDDYFSAAAVSQISDQGEHQLAVRLATGSFMGGTHGRQVFGTVLGTCTISIATPGVVTKAAHGLAAGDRVVFTTTGALPTGLAIGTVYYVLSSGLTADDFQLSATSGGAAINTSGTQSGTHTLRKRTEVMLVDGVPRAFDAATSYRGRRLEFVFISQLMNPAATGTALFDVVTRIEYTATEVILHNRLTALSSFSVWALYGAMLSFARYWQSNAANPEIFNAHYRAPGYTADAITTDTAQTTAVRQLLAGTQGISAEGEMLDGWTNEAGRATYLQITGTSRKWYWSTVPIATGGAGTAITNGQVIDVKTRFRINTAN